jgi:hypothetical protein
MATLHLTDDFGLVIDATLDPGALAKYLKSPQAVIGVLRTAQSLKDLRLSDDPFQSKTVGVAFTEPIALGHTGVELTIKPSFTGTLSITKGAALFAADTDPFRDPVSIPAEHAYLGAALRAALDVTLSDKVSGLQFGFTAGTTITITNYQLCATVEAVVPALTRLLCRFTLPGDLQDLDQLPQGTVVTLEGTGTLQFSAQASLLTIANPLATLNTPFMPIKVAQDSAITISGTCTLMGAYQLRVQRLEARRLRLGYLKQRTSEVSVGVQAQVNTSATVASFDLLKSVLQAVSSDPVPDQAAFHQAGVTDDQLQTIAAAVKVGIERSMALSVTADLDRLDSSATAFSYDIDLALLDDNGRQAVHDALDGDLSGLESTDHAGITRRTSIFDTLRQGKHALKVNLLGIYTHVSVSTLFQSGTIIVDRESGDLTIADQAGAQRIEFTADNFAKDSAKLRQVLAESLLLTTAFRAAGGLLAGPQLASHYWFFALRQKTNREQFTDYLTIAQALRLLSDTGRTAILDRAADITVFGRSTVFIDASYDDALCKRLFVNATGQARAEDEYESLGRQALLLLLLADDSTNDARRLPLTDDTLWRAMKQVGQPGFPTLFAERRLMVNQLADIASDYTLITWWATSMHRMGDALAHLQALFAAHPVVDRENNTFKQLRKSLDDAMASVAANTQAQFGEPWGLLALDLASAQQASTTLQVVTPRMSLSLTRHSKLRFES